MASETVTTVTLSQARISRTRWVSNDVARPTITSVPEPLTAMIPVGESEHLPRAPIATGNASGVPNSVRLGVVSTSGTGAGPVSAHPLSDCFPATWLMPESTPYTAPA